MQVSCSFGPLLMGCVRWGDVVHHLQLRFLELMALFVFMHLFFLMKRTFFSAKEKYQLLLGLAAAAAALTHQSCSNQRIKQADKL